MAEEKEKAESKDEAKEEKKEPASAPAGAPATEEQGNKEVKEEQKEEANPPKADADASEEVSREVEVPAKFKDIVEKIESMSVLDLNELVKLLEKKFGVSAAAVAVAGAGAGDAGEAEEKSEFTVELTSDGGAKIPVMKVVKELLGLGLKEAKDIVEGVPSILKEAVKKVEAEEMKAKIEEAGGKIELK